MTFKEHMIAIMKNVYVHKVVEIVDKHNSTDLREIK